MKELTEEEKKLLGLDFASNKIYPHEDPNSMIRKKIKSIDERMEKEFYQNGAIVYKKQKNKIYCGIDPGKNGAIVFVDPEGKLHKSVMPISGKDVDAQALYDMISEIKQHYDPIIILEDVHSIFGMSASTNFQFGFVCGMIRAIVIVHKIPLHFVPPKSWQKIIWSNPDKVFKPLKQGQKNPSVDTKATTLNAVRRMFPTFDLRKNNKSSVPHDGIVDALAIAEYGRRINL